MGRKPLNPDSRLPLLFRKCTSVSGENLTGETADDLTADEEKKPVEHFIEQALEGLSDYCLLLDGLDRIVYANTSAKHLLRPKGRLLGRKLSQMLADRSISMLAADCFHTGQPMYVQTALTMPGDPGREMRHFLVSAMPLRLGPARRLVRIALRDDVEGSEKARKAAVHPVKEVAVQLKNPLSIVQGYLENLLDGSINDSVFLRQCLLTMQKHTTAIERLVDNLKP